MMQITNNIIFQDLNIFTLSPIIFSMYFTLMVIDGAYKHDKLLTGAILIEGLCLGLLGYGFIELAVWITTLTAGVGVYISKSRKRPYKYQIAK